jgi:hypothetical protein
VSLSVQQVFLSGLLIEDAWFMYSLSPLQFAALLAGLES